MELVEFGIIDAPLSSIKGSSVDVRLHRVIYTEDFSSNLRKVRLSLGESISLNRYEIGADGYIMMPDSIVLGATIERFNLPDNMSAEFSLKSSAGRNFIGHQLAGWIDATFQGTITLELKNDTQFHKLIIDEGLPIGQVKIFRHKRVPKKAQYRAVGQYMGQSEANPAGILT
jgi:dCTP deaminase